MRRPILLASTLALAAGHLWADERVEAPPERAFSAFASEPDRQFDFWIGKWSVNLRIQQEDLSFRDSVRARLETSKGHEFVFLTYTGEDKGWETNVLDDRPETPLARYTSTEEWTKLETDGGRLEWSINDDRLTYTRNGREVRLHRTGSH
ncbi:MAG: hypothetical protein GY769_05385 [bacterium]|nr:hypothetical protein [bacterium]